MRCAFETSILRMRAWGCGLRRIFAHSVPGRLMSAAYNVRPLTLSLPSARGTAGPTTLSSGIVFVLVEFLHVDFSGPLTRQPLSVNVWLLVRRPLGVKLNGESSSRSFSHLLLGWRYELAGKSSQ